ncbi:MAG: redoxin family protein [Phycisphaeraceae bacterium]
MSHFQGSAWVSAMVAGLVAVVLVADGAKAEGPVGGPGGGLVLEARSGDARELGVGRFVPSAEGLTLAGEPKSWEAGRGETATVIALTSVTCPLSKRFAPALGRLEAAYAERGVRFVFVNVGGDSGEAMREQIGQQGFEGLYLEDPEGSVAATLGAETTTEVFVIDRANTMVYRGAVNDQYGLRHAHDAPRHRYLRVALDAVLAGELPGVAATEAPGCLLNQPTDGDEKREAVTYTKDVSRIMQSSCVECHRSGGIGPFTLQSYEDVARRGRMIGAVVEEGVMPPWFAADAADGPSPWHNDRSLTDSEEQTLQKWIEAGMPEGDEAHAPVALNWPETRWTAGEPDVVLEIPEPIAVPAEGTMPYQHVVVRTGLDEDKWVRGFQIVPTAREVVHHVLVFAAPAEVADDPRKIRRAVSGEGGQFAAYVPGNDAVVYPEGFGRKLPADSVLVFQLHYTPNGTATHDQTQIGLIFSAEEPDYVVDVVGIANPRIEIPPGAANHEERAQQRVPMDAKILALMPHMHVRGKAFRYEVERADGERELLLEVPRYDFNWQLRYAYREPMAVQRGDKLHVTAWYDNSAENAANPDPTRTVRWGPQTYDEMLLGYVEFYTVNDAAAAGEAGGEAERATAAGGLSFDRLLERFDANGDGEIARSEVPARLWRIFDRLDRDEDGVLRAGDF